MHFYDQITAVQFVRQLVIYSRSLAFAPPHLRSAEIRVIAGHSPDREVAPSRLIRQVDEPSKLTVRLLDGPEGLIAMLRSRREQIQHGDDDPVFPAVRGGWRDPSNTGADLRDFLKWSGFDGLTSHLIGRKTVASRFDTTGQSARAAADQLGHTRPSMTQDRYYGRRAETNTAVVLAAFFKEL